MRNEGGGKVRCDEDGGKMWSDVGGDIMHYQMQQ